MSGDQTTTRELYQSPPSLPRENEGLSSQNAAIVAKIRPIIATDYQRVVCELVGASKRSIDICAYTWKWYSHQAGCAIQQINRAIIEKARQGLKVRVRLNCEQKDHYLTRENSRTAGFLKRYKVYIKHDHTGTTSHLKMIIIDNEIVIIGSHNLTKRSIGQNNETSVAIFGAEACRDFVAYFKQLWEEL